MGVRNKWLDTSAACLTSLLIAGGALRFIFGIGQSAFYFTCLAVIAVLSLIRLVHDGCRAARAAWQYLMMFLFLLSWLSISIIWTMSVSQYRIDLLLLAAVLVTLLLLVCNFSPGFIRMVQWWLVFFSNVVAVSILYYLGGFIQVEAWGTAVYDFYLTAGRCLALGYITSLVSFLVTPSKKVFWFLSALLHVAALAVTMARGALLFSALIVLLLPIWGIELSRFKLRLERLLARRYLLFTIPAVVVTLFLALQIPGNRLRLLRMLSLGEELSVGGRGLIWSRALDYLTYKPLLGYGLGSSGYLSAGAEELYPHNLFFQIWLDGGVLAFVLLLFIVAFPLAAFLRLKKELIREHLAVFLCYVYLIMEYSKSHSVYTARDLFMFGFAVVLCSTLPESGGKEG